MNGQLASSTEMAWIVTAQADSTLFFYYSIIPTSCTWLVKGIANELDKSSLKGEARRFYEKSTRPNDLKFTVPHRSVIGISKLVTNGAG